MLSPSRLLSAERAQYIQDWVLELGALLIWTVYERPRDFPDHYIARPFYCSLGHTTPLPAHLQAASLESLRMLLPVGLTLLARSPGDDPSIVETWI
jgi:hypothetical protein